MPLPRIGYVSDALLICKTQIGNVPVGVAPPRLVAPLQLGCSAAVVVVVVDFNQNDIKIKRTLSLRDFTADHTHMPTPLGLTMDTLANKMTLIN